MFQILFIYAQSIFSCISRYSLFFQYYLILLVFLHAPKHFPVHTPTMFFSLLSYFTGFFTYSHASPRTHTDNVFFHYYLNYLILFFFTYSHAFARTHRQCVFLHTYCAHFMSSIVATTSSTLSCLFLSRLILQTQLLCNQHFILPCILLFRPIFTRQYFLDT